MTLPSIRMESTRSIMASHRPKRGYSEPRALSRVTVALPAAAQERPGPDPNSRRASISASSAPIAGGRAIAPSARTFRSVYSATRPISPGPGPVGRSDKGTETPAKNRPLPDKLSSTVVHGSKKNKDHSTPSRAIKNNCKERPKDRAKSTKGGSGSSRPFIPWCSS